MTIKCKKCGLLLSNSYYAPRAHVCPADKSHAPESNPFLTPNFDYGSNSDDSTSSSSSDSGSSSDYSGDGGGDFGGDF